MPKKREAPLGRAACRGGRAALGSAGPEGEDRLRRCGLSTRLLLGGLQGKLLEAEEQEQGAEAEHADADCAITCMRPLKADEESGVFFRRLPDLHPHRLLLWVDIRNPLAERKSLKWADLDGKYPMSTQSPIWAAGCVQTLEDHGVLAELRTNAQEDLNNLLAVKEDEFVLLDEQTAISSFIAAIPNHVLIPIDEPDAHCYSYLAYRPENVSEGLRAFIDHVDKAAGI